MSGTERVLLHTAFFERLAEMSESSPDWRAVSAGLVTLRLFDSWMEEGVVAVTPGAWGLRAVRESIAALEPRDQIRALLTSVVDAMEHTRVPRVAPLGPRLMAYGQTLHHHAQWALAADVFATVLAHTDPSAEPDVAIAANMHLGEALRKTADWEGALTAFATASHVAEMTGDIMHVLRARIAEAQVATDRGNLPKAELILDGTIRDSEEAGLTQVRAKAMHDRSVVAYHRKDYNAAVRLQYEALEMVRDPLARDRLLADLASSFAELGLRTAARDAYLVLVATAQEQYVRWAAAINLMQMAVTDGSEPLFEQHRRELVSADLPPGLCSYYHLYVGRGFARFQRVELAKAALEHALEVAQHNGINEVLFEAEKALGELRSSGVILITEHTAPTVTASDASIRAAEAVGRMRATALVGA